MTSKVLELDDILQPDMLATKITEEFLSMDMLRARWKTDKEEINRMGGGGLSGKPLTKRSTEVIRFLAERSGKKFIIIGVGGIHTEADAFEKLNAGADLIQLYTGFIYEGPALIQRIKKQIKSMK